MEDILYVVLNKELGMSAGKAAAQAVHAVALLEKKLQYFVANYRRTVIVLEADNAEQLKNLQEYLLGAGLYSEYYIDEGENEVPSYSVTALAVEPFDSNNEELREIFSSFNLFSHERIIIHRSFRSLVEEEKSNVYIDAIKALENVQEIFQHFDGIEPTDDTPRWLRKAIRKLAKLK